MKGGKPMQIRQPKSPKMPTPKPGKSPPKVSPVKLPKK